jgi:hypothetical protein
MSGKPMGTYASGNEQNLRRIAGPPSRNSDPDRDVKHSWDVELSSFGGQALGGPDGSIQGAEITEVEDADPFNDITGKRHYIITFSSVSTVRQPNP